MLIVLSVLKIIGIVLIVLAAVAAAVLFCPVRYEFDLDIDRRRVSFRINWLLHLLRFRFQYEEKAQLVLSVLFFQFDFLDEEQKEKRRKKREARASRKAAGKKKRSGREDDPSSDKKKKRPGFLRSAVRVISLVRQYDVLETAVPRLRVFLFRIRPRKLRGRIEFGLEDPSATGRIIGGLSLIPVFYQTDLRVQPDFETEESFVRGTAYARGHMLMIHAVIFLVGVLRQKNIRQFIGALRNRG
ncbi:MAG: hypothetical protein LUF32_04125 [Clostridiales bacterium]|nr:hypothetical protein [Clostridiales bacterium]